MRLGARSLKLQTDTGFSPNVCVCVSVYCMIDDDRVYSTSNRSRHRHKKTAAEAEQRQWRRNLPFGPISLIKSSTNSVSVFEYQLTVYKNTQKCPRQWFTVRQTFNSPLRERQSKVAHPASGSQILVTTSRTTTTVEETWCYVWSHSSDQLRASSPTLQI